ncbi:hypothetical protein AWB64_03722 [Caballeronia sordidicola]|uniref:DUF2486 family protein n=1 Tax=Caballeronia sordidicola TaxID=196367 RepID=A0A158GXH8_CABSO|nr:DUF2486 family protein [Caballeronia sordidicola]SAL36603.1 hypothetical protein AWB64_03722 [Caballeronia sordidicola]
MPITTAPDTAESPDNFDSSIPVLTDVIVPGRPERARVAPRAPEPVLSQVALSDEVTRGTDRDADQIAERLRGRFTHFLTGDGRALIEERCRESLQEHSTWLVSQITREVALALETELTEWVREAVADELERRGRA